MLKSISRIDSTILKVFQNQSVVTGSRSLGTVFQNLTGRPMLVNVTVSIFATGGVPGECHAETDSSNPPTTLVTQVRNAAQTVSTGTPNNYLAMDFVVLPNNFYRVRSIGGSVTLEFWAEWI